MKANKYIAGFLALFAAQSASAVTYEITGATAFRRATIEAVNKLYNDEAGNPSYSYVCNNTTYYNSDFITFKGTINGVANTYIRCSFNGSIEGLRALAQPGTSGPTSNGDAYYIDESYVNSVTAGPSGPTAGTIVITADVKNPAAETELERAQAEMAFSDTDYSISPYFAAPLTGVNPGAVVFAVCSTDGSGITNVTTQQYASLLNSGIVPKYFFTGNTADTSKVFCTGRNDGSGTRSSYLSEMGYGVANVVTQYLVLTQTGTSVTTDTITAVQAVPAGGTNDTSPTAGIQLPAGSAIKSWIDKDTPETTDDLTNLQATGNASIVWGQDTGGNGGAASGSALTTALAQTGPSVRVFDAYGDNMFEGTPQTNIAMVTWISLNDAVTARTGGATLCAFNGVSLDLTGNVMTTSDKNKVLNGTYSAWNYQWFYYKNDAAQDVVDLHTSLAGLIETGTLGVAGLKISDFTIGRNGDGGIINPF